MPALDIPTLETERLILRPLVEDDAAVFCALLQDPDVVRYIGDGTIPGHEDCWRAVAAWLGHWVLRGYGPWAVTDRESGTFMGRVGIHFPYGWPGPELAYTLGKPFWGRGYATEATRAAMDWVLRGYGPWAVTDRESGTFMGRVGIHFPYGWPGPELAYTLGKPFWGRGYATEATRAAMDWGFTHRDFLALMSLIYPENGASIRVATKLGETLRGDATLHGKTVLRYVITRPEWEALRDGAAMTGG